MISPLLSLPAELRFHVLSLALCSQGPVELVDSRLRHDKRVRHKQTVEPTYPRIGQECEIDGGYFDEHRAFREARGEVDISAEIIKYDEGVVDASPGTEVSDVSESGSSLGAIRFFTTLPEKARKSITTLALVSGALWTNDHNVEQAWTEVHRPRPKHFPPMATPFGFFLANDMPRLKQVFLYVSSVCLEDFYCKVAAAELHRLLVHKRIRVLSYVFFGKEAAQQLRDGKGKSTCHIAKIAQEVTLAYPLAVFKRFYPTVGPGPDRDNPPFDGWDARREHYAMSRISSFILQWDERDIDMGLEGNVQAVVAVRLR